MTPPDVIVRPERETPRTSPTPTRAPLPLAELGGRFIGRGRLAVGALYWVTWLVFTRRPHVSSGVQREFDALGLGALRLVAGASVLVGLIATFQIAYQLQAYGAETLSARAVGWFAARELGPLVVGLCVVARSAAAIAGELASMSANAELDALRAMGLDPVKYLVAPKLAALLLALPALSIFGTVLVALGGWIGNVGFLNYSSSYFLDQFREAMSVRDIGVGIAKSVLFSFVIAVVPSDEGLSGGRRVASIGATATRAMVYTLIGVLAVDTIVNAVFYFIPVFG